MADVRFFSASLVWFISAAHNVLSFQINHKFQRTAPATRNCCCCCCFCCFSALGRSCQPPGLLPAPPYARATAIELSEKGYLAGKKKTYLFIVFLWRLGIRPKPHTILLKNVKHTPAPPPSLAHASAPAPGGHWELWAKRDTRVLGATGPELSRTQTLSRPAQDNTWWFVVDYSANKATEIRPISFELQRQQKWHHGAKGLLTKCD